MPKLRLSEQQQKNRAFLAAVNKHLTLMSMRKEEFSHLMGMSRSTLWGKLNDPTQFRLYELLQLHKALEFTEEEKHILL